MIGILGGTFDPPHMAHLAVAHAAFDQRSLSEVHLMPAGDPWHKSRVDVSSSKERLAMTSLAAAEAPYLVADDREILRTGPTYTIDTIESLDQDALIILGADAAVDVPGWHRGLELIKHARFAVIPRAGVERSCVTDILGDRFSWLELPLIDISSSDIRAHIAAGHSPRFLVPDAVAAYIESQSMYRTVLKATSTSVPIIALDE